MKKVLIQGAMDIETDYLIEQVKSLPDYEYLQEDNMAFHMATVNGKKIIVQTTGMGTIKAAMATTYAIEKIHPTLVINQGTAGAQEREFGVGDVILAEAAVNINQMSMPKKELGEGSDPFTWEKPSQTREYEADKTLLALFSNVEYTAGRMIKGKIATGDIYSRETDRIIWLAESYGTCAEDMETAAVFEVCETFETPCMGLRVISNNELKGNEFNGETAGLLQEYVWKVIYETL